MPEFSTLELQGRVWAIDDALKDLDEEEIIMVLEVSSQLPVILKERLSGQRWELLKRWLAQERDAGSGSGGWDGPRHQGTGLIYSKLLGMMEDLEKNPSQFVLP